MEGRKTLVEYLNGLKVCDDPDRLEGEFKIENYWPALLYGDAEKLFAQLAEAYRNSPQEGGLKYNWADLIDLGDTKQFHLSYDNTIRVRVQLVKGQHTLFVMSGKNQIDGLEHCMHISFHPRYNDESLEKNILTVIKNREPEGIQALNAMAAAVAEFCGYAIANNLTLRLPSLGISYKPN